jgi:hypothetical protein
VTVCANVQEMCFNLNMIQAIITYTCAFHKVVLMMPDGNPVFAVKLTDSKGVVNIFLEFVKIKEVGTWYNSKFQIVKNMQIVCCIYFQKVI